MNIDIHAHIIPRSCLDSSGGQGIWPVIVRNSEGQEELQDDRRKSMAVEIPLMCDPEARIVAMDKVGIDVQVLSPPPSLMYYQLDVESSLGLIRKMNDSIAEIVRQYPKRFAGLASVPLQDSAASVRELDRALSMGLSGVEILSNVAGKQLDEPEFEPFFKAAEAADLPIFIHPFNVTGAERMKKYYLANFIGNPLDTAMAVAHLIFGGVIERHPGLKFCLSHAGGILPIVIGRWDHGFSVRKEARVAIDRPPSTYLKAFYFDTITHSIPALEYLLGLVGADRIVLGTDFPFDMEDDDPVGSVGKLVDLPSVDRELILGGNARSVFGI